MLDYRYTKNHYRQITVELSRQKELGADPKANQQIEFVGQLKNENDQTFANESMFVLTELKKIKKRK